MSLALAVAARAVREGSWLAAVGVPMLGIEAAGELGIPLSRVVTVDAGTGPKAWAERVAAAADGFELILTDAPPGAERVARQVRHRLQAKGAVLLAASSGAPKVGCDMELATGEAEWSGVGAGHGHLVARRVAVRAAGRRLPGPVERELWLPGRDGRVAVAPGQGEISEIRQVVA